MSQPPAYSQLFSFAGFSASSPNAQQPGAALDAEFADISTTLTAVLANLALIQRDDGPLANNSVGINQLDATGLALIGANGFNVRGPWAALTAYKMADVYSISNALYLVMSDHTSNPNAAVDVVAGRVIGPILATSAGVLPGNAVLNGTVDPASGTGQNGDFYINTISLKIFGPKAAGVWPAGASMVGPQGTAGSNGSNGSNGTNGTNGTNGASVLNGTVNPAAGTGANGDFYINTTSSTLFGPKAAGAWPAGVSLIGAAGAGTGDMLRANNLSDLVSAATSRGNLGVTATGADTTYNYRANNLSDVASAATARGNLGAASTATVTSVANGLAPASGGGTTNFLRADGSWASPAGSGFTYAHFQEQQASGVSGASALASAVWTTLVLNATALNGIGSASLASNQFTLPAGTYEISAIAMVAVGAGSGSLKLRVRNITDGTTAIVGAGSANQSGKEQSMTLQGQLVIAGSKAMALQYYGSGVPNGLGSAVTSGEVEVYTSVYIRKIA